MRRFLVFALLLSTLALAACDAPAPTAPCTVTVSKQAADQFLQRARQTLVPGRPVTLTANNQEVTSLFSQLLEQSRTQNPSDVVPLENPVVCFESGKASVFGMLRIGSNAPVAALITFSASISAGKPVFKVDQIQLGPVAVPADLSQELTNVINRIIGQYTGSVSLTEIRFTAGQVFLAGQLRNAP